MHKKPSSEDFITHKLTVILDHSGSKGWDYKSKSKVTFYDETTKKKLSPYQFQQWIDSPHIVDMINRGANLKIATQDYEEETGEKIKSMKIIRIPKNGANIEIRDVKWNTTHFKTFLGLVHQWNSNKLLEKEDKLITTYPKEK